jgi:hypothetical protein
MLSNVWTLSKKRLSTKYSFSRFLKTTFLIHVVAVVVDRMIVLLEVMHENELCLSTSDAQLFQSIDYKQQSATKIQQQKCNKN